MTRETGWGVMRLHREQTWRNPHTALGLELALFTGYTGMVQKMALC